MKGVRVEASGPAWRTTPAASGTNGLGLIFAGEELTPVKSERLRACDLVQHAAETLPAMDLPNLLPHVNATLNAAAMVLLGYARVMIARQRIEQHRRAMLAALAVSALFLGTYIAYHYAAPIFVFRGHGWIRPVYYLLLISHIVFAAAAIPLVLVTAFLGLRRIDARHRAIARWTWPIWMYVSVSGVVVYLLLYQIYR